jgi:hypothetical protein
MTGDRKGLENEERMGEMVLMMMMVVMVVQGGGDDRC